MQQGLDGAIDRPPPAVLGLGRPTLRRKFGFGGVRNGRTRLAMFPRQPSIKRLGPNVDSMPESRGLQDEDIDRTVSGRVGVDSWAEANRGSRCGRASEMV